MGWVIYRPSLSEWTTIYQSLMNTTSLEITKYTNTYNIYITGFSQAFQFMNNEYKKIHNEPFPG